MPPGPPLAGPPEDESAGFIRLAVSETISLHVPVEHFSRNGLEVVSG